MGVYRTAYVIGALGKGGAEYQLYELLRLLDRTRFAPRVFSLAPGGYWAEPIRGLGITVEELARGGSADVARLGRLRAALRAFAPDLLHTVMWSGNSYGRLAALGLGIPAVIAAERNVIRRPRWQVLIERLLDRMTDGYVVNSEAIAVELSERGGLARRKITVVPNGIDLGALPPLTIDRHAARRVAGFDPARRLVAQVGRLTAQKDYPTFLRAAVRIAARHPDVDFLVVGSGELQVELERLAAALGLGTRVRFTGLRHDVPALLGGVDVLTLTSRYEGLPNVVIEAMAAGAVVVATDVGGCRDVVVDGITGALVPPAEPEAVSAAVVGILEDAARAERLAQAARARIEEHFTIERMAAHTIEVYLAVLRGRSPRGTGRP
jgi:glycosyltransferase involved in cell wall biosynthesis